MRRRIVTLAEWDKSENILDFAAWISTMGSRWMTECAVKRRPRTFPSTAPTSAMNEAQKETDIHKKAVSNGISSLREKFFASC